MNEHSINIGISLDSREYKTGLENVAADMKKAAGFISQGAQDAANTTKFAFKSIQQAYNTTIRDAENLAMTQGTQSQAFKDAAARASAYRTELERVHDELAKARIVLNGGSEAMLNTNKSANLLGYSMAQMTRELPAFAMSAQVGFLALSNNIPIFLDAVTRFKDASRTAKEAGREVQSIGSALGSALFSWQTGLSIGVTLLTIYGSKLVEFVGNMFDAESAIKKVKQAQEDYNKKVYEYTASDKQKAIDEENKKYDELIKTASTSQAKFIALAQGRAAQNAAVSQKEIADYVTAKKQIETIEAAHQANLAEIEKRYAEKGGKGAKTGAKIDMLDMTTLIEQGRAAEGIYNEFFANVADLATPTSDQISNLTGLIEDNTNKLFENQYAAMAAATAHEKLMEGVEGNIQAWAQLSTVIAVAATGALGQFAESIGAALAGFEDFNVGEILGNLAAQVGSAMMAMGGLMLAGVVTGTIGGQLLAAGAGMMVLAGALKAGSKNASASPVGGGSTGGTANARGFTYDTMGLAIVLDGRVRGSDIVISSYNQTQKNKRVK